MNRSRTGDVLKGVRKCSNSTSRCAGRAASKRSSRLCGSPSHGAGAWPEGMRGYLVRVSNYQYRIWTYVAMVENEYPTFGLPTA